MLLLSLLLWLSCGVQPTAATSTGTLASQPEPDGTPIVATVGGLPITALALWEAAGRHNDPAWTTSPEEKRRLLRELAWRLSLPAEAERRGYRQDPRLAETLRTMVLLLHVTDGIDQRSFTEAELQRAYEAHRDELVVPVCVDLQRVRIRVGERRSEAAAQAEIEEIAAILETDPDAFLRVAFERSDDLHSVYRCERQDGSSGAGGPSSPGRSRLPPEPEVVARAFAQPVGQRSAPFRTALGYNLVQTLDRRGGETLPFERSRDKLRRILITEAEAAAKAEFLAAQRDRAGWFSRLSDEELLDRAVVELGVDQDVRIPEWMVALLLDDVLFAFDKPDSFTTAELRAYLLEHPEAYRVPEQVRASVITVAVTEARPEREARARAEAIWRALQADPAQFETLARERSDDRAAPNGGNVSTGGAAFAAWARAEPALAAAIPEIAAGTFSAPLRGAQGYSIVAVNARRLGREGSVELDETRLRQALHEERASARRKASIDAMLAGADLVIDEAALDALALNQRPAHPAISPFQGLPDTLR